VDDRHSIRTAIDLTIDESLKPVVLARYLDNDGSFSIGLLDLNLEEERTVISQPNAISFNFIDLDRIL
jgi:hypothetical protein